ncbi:MAG: isoprenylcysteine carboxylmethyltransferase family protein [Anaerolineaceae bacterium]
MIILSILAVMLVPLIAFVLLPYLFITLDLAQMPTRLGFQEILAGVLIVAGLVLVAWVIFAHAKYGKGTPAPFNPPKNFVAGGAYRYSRNPMYVGALTILIGESLFFRSPGLLVFAVLLFILFAVYVHIEEEPRLVQRFGDSYKTYMKTVPRWLSLKLPRK